MYTEHSLTLRLALFYLKNGFSIIPIKGPFLAKGITLEEKMKDVKTPLIKWAEFQKRKPTMEEVEGWFTKWRKANIAIVTGKVSGIVVVDFDSDKAIEWANAEGLLNTATVKTGKGLHAYYRYPDNGFNIQNLVDGEKRIDVRADGGYVVAPPSRYIDGTEYRWVRSLKEGYAALPECFPVKKRGAGDLRKLYGGVKEGGRNNSLAKLVGSWVNDGLSLEECMENARLWNTKNQPPLDEVEMKGTVKSILKRHYLTQGEKRLAYYEKNLIRYSLFTFDRTLIYKAGKIEIVDNDKKRGISRIWLVSADATYGLGGPFDDVVFTAVMKIVSDMPKPVKNPVQLGSLKEFVHILSIASAGNNIKRVRESIKRIAYLTVNSKHCFIDKEKKRYVDNIFHIFDRVEFIGEKLSDGTRSERNLVWMNAILLQNINAGYVLPIDFDIYLKLDGYIPRAIYKLLLAPVFMINKGLPITVKYKTICKKCQIKEEKFTAYAKKQLFKPHKELIKYGVIDKAQIWEKSGILYVAYHRGFRINPYYDAPFF